MTLIGTLRDKMTKWVVGFVALSISAFILNDLLGDGSILFGGSDNDVGEIDGQTITLDVYQGAVKKMEEYYALNYGRSPDKEAKKTIREQAWNTFIDRYVVTPQYEKLGITVTETEVWDFVQGDNIHVGIRQSFSDSSGSFDRSKLMDYLQELNEQPEESASRMRWMAFLEEVTAARLKTKYENLIAKTNYITRSEAERAYHLQNDKIQMSFIYIPFYAVQDSLITITETDIRSYYDTNKEKYKMEKSRNLRYVLFPVIPSEADSLTIRRQLEELITDFAFAEQDSSFATIHSDVSTVVSSHTVATLPPWVRDKKDSLKASDVLGPFREGGTYKLIKLISVGKSDGGSARANHILIKWDNDSPLAKREANRKAQKILNDIKNGADFASKAREFGSDGTASQGGDLGWFERGKMVKPFEEAVFQSKKTGLIPRLIETQFGYHIIEVVNLNDDSSYTLVTIERKIVAGDETLNTAYRRADAFRGGLNSVEDFDAKAERDSTSVYDANEIKTNATKINNLEEARQVVLWLFKDAERDKISDVFTVGDNYMVAVMTGGTEEGYKPLEQINEEIKSIIAQDKKAEYIMSKLKEFTGPLEDMKDAFPALNVTFYPDQELTMETNSFPLVGLDPIAVGKAFSLNEGDRSSPFKGQNGVLIVEIKEKTVASEIADYAVYSKPLLDNQNGVSRTALYQALKENTQIEDTRYLFY